MLHYIAQILLKMKVKLNVSQRAIQEIVQDMNSIHDLAKADVRNAIAAFCNDRGMDNEIAQEISDIVYDSDPFSKYTSNTCKQKGILSSNKRRDTFFKRNLKHVAPVEYMLGFVNKVKCFFVYIPLIQLLQELLSNVDILDKVLNSDTSKDGVYKSYRDGNYFKTNELFRSEGVSIQLGFYYDDFECVNPIGTSKKKHKIAAFYWVFTNLPPECRSTLHSIQLCTLCKVDDLKYFGMEKVLNPFLRDAACLEQYGVYVASLGQSIKGTISYISSDNLGAHIIGGLTQSFSNAAYICRFCNASSKDIQDDLKMIESFELRTPQGYDNSVAEVMQDDSKSAVCGIKSGCVFHKYLQHFHVTRGLAPDPAHDLLEGIVPYEMALCLNALIAQKLITLDYLNSRIENFEYLHNDRVDRPQKISDSFHKTETVGGNVAENWALLRMLPFLIGDKIDQGNIFWEVMMELKDITEIVFAPTVTDEVLAYLDAKIGYHRTVLREAFPNVKIKPKAHYLEHYPKLMQNFGPLSACWTLRFEGKHSFFKKFVHMASNFKNLLFMLVEMHQLNLAVHLRMPNFFKFAIEAFSDSEVDTLCDETKAALGNRPTCAENETASACKWCVINGVKYSRGMCVAMSSRFAIVQFGQIEDIVIAGETLLFVMRILQCEYWEHFRCIEVKGEGALQSVNCKDLKFYYPLPLYEIGSRKYIMPKYYMCIVDDM